MITVLLLAGPANLVSPDVLTTSEPSEPSVDAQEVAMDAPAAPADAAAGSGQDEPAEGDADDGLDALPGVIDLMLGAADAIAANLRQSSSNPLVEERVDRVFTAIDKQFAPWLAAIGDQLAEVQVDPTAVITPLQSCGNQVAAALWDLLDSWLEKELPATAALSPTGERDTLVSPVEDAVALDPWLAAVAIAGLVGREWIPSRKGETSPAEKNPSPRARSRRQARPLS